MNHHPPPPHLSQPKPPMVTPTGPIPINRVQVPMRGISIECIILEQLDFKAKMDGFAIATYRVADETGSIMLVVKLDASDQLRAGDIVRFQDIEVKSPNRQMIQLNATRPGNVRLKRIGSDTKSFHEHPYWTESDWYWDHKLQHMALNLGPGPMNQMQGGIGGPGMPQQQRLQGNNMQPAINPAFQNNQRPGPGPMHGPRPPFQGGNQHGHLPHNGPGMGPGMGPNGPGVGKGGLGMRQGSAMGPGGPNMGQGMGPGMGPGAGPNMAPMPRPGPHSNGYRPGHQGPPHPNGHQGPPPPHQGPSPHHGGRPGMNNNNINNNSNNNNNNGNANNNNSNNSNNSGGQASAHPSLPPTPPSRKFKKPKIHRDLDAPDSYPSPRSGLASSQDEFTRDMKIVAQGGVGLGVDSPGKNKKRP